MPLPCIVCDKELESAIGENPDKIENQPYSGTAFTTHGHYGSTVFDLEPGFLEINVCDECLLKKQDHVLHGVGQQIRTEVQYKIWDTSYLNKET